MTDMPFTTAEFLDVFRDYNQTVFPMQIVLFVMAIVATLLAVRNRNSGKIICLILAFFWMWMGAAYHVVHFAAINKLAYIFGGVFILQGILFLLFGVVMEKLTFHFKRDIYGVTGLFFIVFALFIYPFLGTLGSHAYPYSPTFGLPCPTTIFTFGIILLSEKKFPVTLLLIPFLWSVLGISAALNFGIREDWFLIFAGATTLFLTFIRNRKFSEHSKLLSVEI